MRSEWQAPESDLCVTGMGHATRREGGIVEWPRKPGQLPRSEQRWHQPMYRILGFSRKFAPVTAPPLTTICRMPYTNFLFSSKSGPGKRHPLPRKVPLKTATCAIRESTATPGTSLAPFDTLRIRCYGPSSCHALGTFSHHTLLTRKH